MTFDYCLRGDFDQKQSSVASCFYDCASFQHLGRASFLRCAGPTIWGHRNCYGSAACWLANGCVRVCEQESRFRRHCGVGRKFTFLNF